jgi:hypothetical protein
MDDQEAGEVMKKCNSEKGASIKKWSVWSWGGSFVMNKHKSYLVVIFCSGW